MLSVLQASYIYLKIILELLLSGAVSHSGGSALNKGTSHPLSTFACQARPQRGEVDRIMVPVDCLQYTQGLKCSSFFGSIL